MIATGVTLTRMRRRIQFAPNAKNYRDLALTPVTDDEDANFDLLTKTTGARDAVAHIRKVAAAGRATASAP